VDLDAAMTMGWPPEDLACATAMLQAALSG
jgi:hypothetical protein